MQPKTKLREQKSCNKKKKAKKISYLPKTKIETHETKNQNVNHMQSSITNINLMHAIKIKISKLT